MRRIFRRSKISYSNRHRRRDQRGGSTDSERLSPGTKEYMIPSHRGKEPASELLMKELGLHPVIDARLALGEGTGAVMMFSLLDMAMTLYETGATFGDFHIEEYHRF